MSLHAAAADAILVLHFLFVLFVVLGLALVVLGGRRDWRWVSNPWFRLTHLAAIAVVVLQAWLGEACPLTRWEMALRAAAAEPTYSGSFIGHWVSRVLYYHAPDWVFIACYTVFGALVLACWFRVPPRPFRRAGGGRG